MTSSLTLINHIAPFPIGTIVQSVACRVVPVGHCAWDSHTGNCLVRLGYTRSLYFKRMLPKLANGWQIFHLARGRASSWTFVTMTRNLPWQCKWKLNSMNTVCPMNGIFIVAHIPKNTGVPMWKNISSGMQVG